MSLKDLALRNQYRSDRHNLLQDFYVPCLSRAVAYDRAFGFFSSTSLALAAQGLSYFIQSNGQMRLVDDLTRRRYLTPSDEIEKNLAI